MKSRAWLIIGLFLIWGAGSTYWYVCKIKGFCAHQPQQTVTKPERKLQTEKTEKKPVDLIYFEKNSDVPVVADSLQWTAEVKSISQLKAEGKKLFIYGPYYKGENNNTNFDNLGLARAFQLKKMMYPSLDTSLVMMRSKLLEGDEIPDEIAGFKDYFQWKTYNNFVKENDKNVLLYFPFNSTKEIKNNEILSYLDELAAKLKSNSTWRVNLVGHTDNVGNEASNLKLSKKRANRIKAILIKKGVSANQITSIGKGESEPIADNKTEKGRQKNRRVEINIIK